MSNTPAYLMTRLSDGASPLVMGFPVAADWTESPQLRVHSDDEEVFGRICILYRDSWSAEARYNKFSGR